MQRIDKNEATATNRLMYFHLVDATDGLTPENGENGEQPQIAYDGGNYTNTGGTLVFKSNGEYYVQLTQAEVNKVNKTVVRGRYKSANTAEGKALPIQIVDPMADVVESTLTLKQVLRIILAALAGKSTGGDSAAIAYRDVADGKNRIAATVDTDGNRVAVVLDSL